MFHSFDFFIMILECQKQRMSSPPMKNAAYKFSPDSGVDHVQNGTLASIVCDKGYELVKKAVKCQSFEKAIFNLSDAFFCHYSVWVGRKAIDLGYKCVPTSKFTLNSVIIVCPF